MRKPNKKAQEHRQKSAEKKAARKRTRKHICRERLNHKSNIIEEKKLELFNKWMNMVNRNFSESK